MKQANERGLWGCPRTPLEQKWFPPSDSTFSQHLQQDQPSISLVSLGGSPAISCSPSSYRCLRCESDALHTLRTRRLRSNSLFPRVTVGLSEDGTHSTLIALFKKSLLIIQPPGILTSNSLCSRAVPSQYTEGWDLASSLQTPSGKPYCGVWAELESASLGKN